MMMREAAGIVGISLVVGLLVVGLAPRRGSKADVSMVSSTCPERFERSVGSRPVLSFGLVANREIVEMKLAFSVMLEADPRDWVSEPGSWVYEGDLGKGRTGLIPVDLWLEQADARGSRATPQKAKASVNGTEYDAYVYDFRDVSGAEPCMAVFALLFMDGNLSKAYWGYSDFFAERGSTIESLGLEAGESSEVYTANPKDKERFIDELPADAVFTLRNLSVDEEVLVSMTLEGYLVPAAVSWLWACRAETDGVSEEVWILSAL